MGPSVAVTLDKERFLRFGYRNSRFACSALQNVMPARAEKLSIGDASMLVLKPDQDAVLVFLYRGLNWDGEDKIKMDQIERWLENALDAKRDLSEFSLPILEALKQAGLVTLNYKTSTQDDSATNGAPTVGAFIDPGDPLARRPLSVTSHDESRE
jgi:hypothetical protein